MRSRLRANCSGTRPGVWASVVGALLVVVAGYGCDRREPSSTTTAAPRVATPDDLVATYVDCWGAFNQRELGVWDACFTRSAVLQPVDRDGPVDVTQSLASAKQLARAFSDLRAEVQFVLVASTRVVGVLRFTGTNDGPFELGVGDPLPPRHGTVGFLSGQVMDFDPSNKLAIRERSYFDPTALFGQAGLMNLPHSDPVTTDLPEKGTVVLARGTAEEQRNLGAVRAAVEAFNRHDADAVQGLLASDVAWYDSSAPGALTTARIVEGLRTAWSGSSDLKLVVEEELAAGDYVMHAGTLDGTNDGDQPSLERKASGRRIHLGFMHVAHLRDGKVDKLWRFVQGMNVHKQLGDLP